MTRRANFRCTRARARPPLEDNGEERLAYSREYDDIMVHTPLFFCPWWVQRHTSSRARALVTRATVVALIIAIMGASCAPPTRKKLIPKCFLPEVNASDLISRISRAQFASDKQLHSFFITYETRIKYRSVSSRDGNENSARWFIIDRHWLRTFVCIMRSRLRGAHRCEKLYFTRLPNARAADPNSFNGKKRAVWSWPPRPRLGNRFRTFGRRPKIINIKKKRKCVKHDSESMFITTTNGWVVVPRRLVHSEC